jgi:hypothetical protein
MRISEVLSGLMQTGGKRRSAARRKYKQKFTQRVAYLGASCSRVRFRNPYKLLESFDATLLFFDRLFVSRIIYNLR